MEPIPETQAALRQLSQYQDDDVNAQLSGLADQAQHLVPSLVGLSLTEVSKGVTLTYAATDSTVAALDGLQYADSGPCEEAVGRGERVNVDHRDLLDEGRWQLFAQGSAAAGVQSTLSLPTFDGAAVSGSVNLYGARPDSFDGQHAALADLFGAWAAGAVTNADLSFSSRLEAAKAPAILEDAHTIDVAIGVLAHTHQVSTERAEENLRQAAARAGVPVVALAMFIVHPPEGR
ncbi:GAF and ANTAR domain-containing protein [Humibacillus xanthopallidus]|uniref:GAF and ANTAR domain-containing protein n=1 Tax=Humibacillus xanthopallidus TaxID=412689 RepID=UPI00385009A1